MTKDERIAIIAVCAKLEEAADRLVATCEQLENQQDRQAVFEQISSLHNIIGELLSIGQIKR